MPPPLEIVQHDRKPMRVDAVQVTSANIGQVAKWCGGYVATTIQPDGSNAKFVKVHVLRPGNVRQTMAHVDDWILRHVEKAGETTYTTYKVYTTNAFKASFNPAPAPAPQAVDA